MSYELVKPYTAATWSFDTEHEARGAVAAHVEAGKPWRIILVGDKLGAHETIAEGIGPD